MDDIADRSLQVSRRWFSVFSLGAVCVLCSSFVVPLYFREGCIYAAMGMQGAGMILTLVVNARAKRALQNRAREERCQECGYDLRAHHPGENCPE